MSALDLARSGRSDRPGRTAQGRQTRQGINPPAGVENGRPWAAWARLDGPEGTFRPKCCVSRSGRPGHPEGRSESGGGAARLNRVGGAEAIRGGVAADGGDPVRQ